MKPPASIELFLHLLKQYVEKNSFVLVERDATLRFLASRGMSVASLTELILSLEVGDCFDGPEPDRDSRFAEAWTVAEFSPLYLNEKLYLKLSIRTDRQRVKCLSVKAYIERVVSDE